MSLFKVVGANIVISNLQKAAEETEKRIRKGNIKGALIIEREAKKKAPVRTGNLKGSIFSMWKNKGDISFENIGRDEKGRFTKSGTISSEAESRAFSEQIRKKLNDTTAAVGVGANYGVFVHELHPTKKKFLKNAERESKGRVLEAQKRALQGK